MVEMRTGKVSMQGTDGWNRLGENGKILATRVGLRFPAKLDYREWERAGGQLARIADSSTWCLGDWLAYGQAEYADRYQRAIELAGLDYQTLRNYAWVVRKFDWPRRRSRLSFQHHAEVAALPEREQEMYLELAEAGGWSRNRLRRHIREGGLRGRSPETPTLPRMRVPADYFTRWREAAEHAGITFEHWVIGALNDAASVALTGLPD